MSASVLDLQRRRSRSVLLFCAILFCVAFFSAFLLGRYPVRPGEILPILLYKPRCWLHAHCALFSLPTVQWSPEAFSAVWNIRLPRVLAAGLVGAGLSAAGISYQGLFRNPMVSPDVLGASSGAAFGAALGLFFSLSRGQIIAIAFGTGLLAVLIVQTIANRVHGSPVLGLVLGGIMVSSIFSSSTSFLKLIADPDNTLPAITYWLMGDLSSIYASEVKFAAIPIGIGLLILFLLRWRLNVLTLEEDEARSMGVDTRRLRAVVIFSATLITAACVSISGMIGWVGLVIPHFVRMMGPSDYRVSYPCSLLLGGGFLILVDDLARNLSSGEIPLGILTSFVGAPFFLYLILKEGNRI